MIARPSAFNARMIRNSCVVSRDDSELVGSSNAITRASRISALPISIICRWPIDRFFTCCDGSIFSPSRSSSRTRASPAPFRPARRNDSAARRASGFRRPSVRARVRRARRRRRRKPRRATGSPHSARVPHGSWLPSAPPIRSANCSGRRHGRPVQSRPLRPVPSQSAGRWPVPIPTTSRHRARTSPRRADRARASARPPTRRSRSSSRSAHRA